MYGDAWKRYWLNEQAYGIRRLDWVILWTSYLILLGMLAGIGYGASHYLL